MNENQLTYTIKHMLEINNWRPSFEGDLNEFLNQCDSRLEILFVLGMLKQMEEYRKKNGFDPEGSVFASEEELVICNAWDATPTGEGKSALIFIPQYKVGAYTVDFAVFSSSDNAGNKHRSLYTLIEIDGYGVHKSRRNQDNARDQIIKNATGILPMRLREELDSPQTWYGKWISDEQAKFDMLIMNAMEAAGPLA